MVIILGVDKQAGPEKHAKPKKYARLKKYAGLKKYFRLRPFGSLRFHIILLVACAGFIPAMVLKAVLLESYESHAVEVRTAEIQNQCTILCGQLGTQVDAQDGLTEDVQSELTQISNIYNGRVMVIDEHYRISEDTYNMDNGKSIVSANVIRCFSGTETTYYDARNQYIEVTAPIRNPATEKIKGVVLACISTDWIADSKDVLDRKGTLVLAAAGLILILSAVAAGTWMVRPIRRMAKSIDEVTEGYGGLELHENKYTETKRLSEAFNKAMSRMRALDDSRQEFVANVSHELKTPLTSMKVLADSLLGQENVPVGLYQEFMEDISEEIERENKIINDLLSLVKLDKTADTMNIRMENINQMVERILKRLRPLAKQRNIEMVYESFRLVQAEVDEMKLSLAITNLVENAVKYNREGGWVHVSLDADLKSFWLVISDNGIGIPKADQPHIFERFYRVDKSHSREIGGTGLGLSIARSAVVLHRGAIKCSSGEKEGTSFTVKIPLYYVV